MSKGFTLMELMIGIAIIGTIGYVAAYNVDCLTKNAEDTEAKTELTSALAAEKIHFAKFGSYTGCLKQAGYRPRPDRMFTIGFSAKAVLDGQPKCGRSNDPKYYFHPTFGMMTHDGSLNCNTWGNRATNVCNVVDAPINSPDSTSDINFAANKAAGNSIPIAFPNQGSLQTPCRVTSKSSLDGKTMWSGCWGAISNTVLFIPAIRGRTFNGQTNLSGYWVTNSGDIISFEAARPENY
jgi:prepilin-type N-terminal cleavage/methylation domain-containing protein